MDPIFALHLASTLFMTGVIWFVQMVHYPLFAAFDRATFATSMKINQARTAWVVVPAMLVELGTALLLLWQLGARGWVIANLSLLLLTWALTFFVSVPIHSSLATRFDDASLRKLVTTNWGRTALWSLRCSLLLLQWEGS